ncbi:winged helix-turn-helix domain-containing protein [Streptomyces sp. WMMC500]|uniref:winged helix-turn-helix domain-containing protein n=1 Tax=Streptomyces sp. WMMC500 TaxID=3015154 RepID=UPI00248D3050|nr:winged helix-turn-helix domain-containing protein [Streptomyces sp. WMMC500]WBB58892.1 winged helix-turn-helix domain-containing protein [Streptomyces sp. WMMC500]
MLHIEFTSADLNRLRLAGDVSPMWEVVLSLQALQTDHAALALDPWRRRVRADLRAAGLGGTLESLQRLCPEAAYFPDFLTPASAGGRTLDAELDQVLTTPKGRLRKEIGRLCGYGRPPRGARRLADGDAAAMRRLGDAVRRYYAVAVAPYREAIRSAAAADRPVRADAALGEGAEGLLASFAPEVAWRGDRLECAYPVDRGFALEGRPLTLIPSFFCTRRPVALADPDLPPVLVHPLTPAPGWLPDSDPGRGPDSLVRLIGLTRARVLELLDRPMSTGRIADALYVAPASASRHAAVLREAGLVRSERRGPCVMHRRTDLGEALLNGG